jgi:hypothetical protein
VHPFPHFRVSQYLKATKHNATQHNTTNIQNTKHNMKFSLALTLSAISGAAAFAPTSIIAPASAKFMSEASLDDEMVIEEPVEELPTKSMSLPFMDRPAALTGALAGDVGFDPLGFATSEADLMNYREAEVKHARLAMLAAAGWPLSEVFDKKIAVILGMNPLLDAADRAPSLLNGGLGKVSPIYWIACIGAAAAVEFYGINKSKINYDENYFPGNLGFDPFGVYPKDEAGQQRMQLAEIKNGRLAMIAIFAFAIQEFVSKQGIVDETPFFFFPLLQTMKMYTNSGYIQ